MSSVTIRDLDERTYARLRTRALANGRSVEAEVCAILDAVVDLPEQNVLVSLHASTAEVGGVELTIPDRPDYARPVCEPGSPAPSA